MTVRDLLARTSSRELTEWQVYERLSGPLGGRRQDVLTGVLGSVIVNSQRGKGQRAIAPADFVPTWGERPRKKTPEELFQAAMAANLALGGHVRVPGDN